MNRGFRLALLGAGLAFVTVAYAQDQHPMLDAAATRLVQKYQSSSCQQLAAERQAPASPQKEAMKQRAGQYLREDAQARQEFVARVAAPIVDKMIVCGFIP